MIIQTTNQPNLEAVARQALPTSATNQAITELVLAIRSANPGLDLDSIQPGMTILVPISSATTTGPSAVAKTLLAQVESQVATAIRELSKLAHPESAATTPAAESTPLTAVTQQWIAQVNRLTAGL
jgi:hypothetical protein